MPSRALATAAYALLALALPSPAHAQASPASAPGRAGGEVRGAATADLAAIKAATVRYTDVKVALADGYLADPENHCVTADMIGLPPETGAMGVHYLHPGLVGVTATAPRLDGSDVALDWQKPELLLYEPQADGELQLVGVEYLVFEEPWHETGNTGPPALLDHPFTHMKDDPGTELDEGHGFEPHYDLHVWLFRENPAGTFAGFNPAVSCAHWAPTKEHTGH